MGCGGSVPPGKTLQEALDESEKQLAAEKRLLRDKDAQLVGLDRNIKEQREAPSSASELRAELERRQQEHKQELEMHRESLLEQHRKELDTMEEEQDAAHNRILLGRTEIFEQGTLKKREKAEQLIQTRVAQLREAAVAEVAQHSEEAQDAERELHKLRHLLGPLRIEHEEATDALREARRLLLSEESCQHISSQVGTSSLEQQLAEAQEERVRSEQRYADLEKHLRAQMADLQGELVVRSEELHQRNCVLLRRDHELTEVNSQLADLQGLFDEINNQLQMECGRIEKMQEAVAQCAKQSKDLENLQGMLEDSHRMLVQVRDAVERERTDRVKASDLLEHEQQRTQLLLDVLKHFKEKLQGLTPQMLLNRLGCFDQKVLPTNAIASNSAVGHVAPTVNGNAGVRVACGLGDGARVMSPSTEPPRAPILTTESSPRK